MAAPMLGFDGSAIPDVAGELIGWRAWMITGPADRPRLMSMNDTGTVWPAGAWLHAVCGMGHTHAPPHEHCSCGIYAAHSHELLWGMNYHLYEHDIARVIGEVGLAGKVIRGARGFRGARARPLRLLVPYEEWPLGVALRDAYRVPIELANTFRHPAE